MSDKPTAALDAEFVAAYTRRLHRVRNLEAFILAKADELENAGRLSEAAAYRTAAGQDATVEPDWTGIVT